MSTKQSKISKNSYFMSLALMEARKALGNTKTNPAVGCVVVKNKCVISAACTSKNGRPHAEHNALNLTKTNISNANLYVTLEPCSHYGKTPPCVSTIVKKKISRVYFSIKDPDPRSFNKSSPQFKKKKIIVKVGICSKQIKNFYRSYLKYKKDDLPFVTSKLAISRDYYTSNKKKKWLTNRYSRGRVHLMRSNHDCILTSAKTIIDDNPRLNCRIDGLENNSPCVIILDKKLIIPVKSKIINTSKHRKTFIFYNKNDRKKLKVLKNLKIKLIRVRLANDGNFDLKNLLIKIKKKGYSRVFLEAGLNLTTNFVSKNLVDDFHLFVSKDKIGNNGYNNFKKYIKLFLKKKKCVKQKVNLFGDKLLSYKMQ